MEKINVAELLKDCPNGMELDCTTHNECSFDSIVEDELYPITIRTPEGSLILTKYGSMSYSKYAKCLIFPKGRTTWEGFVPPCKFKDGDILSYQCRSLNKRTIYIYRHNKVMNTSYYVALSGDIDSTFMINDNEEWTLNGYNDTARLASEEEKQKLFKAIKDNGYRWNAEAKTLEELVEPKFKEGDKIQQKNQHEVCLVSEVRYNHYLLDEKDIVLPFFAQDDWELVPDKFDIATLKPFDKVLVRDFNYDYWIAAHFSHYAENIEGDYHYYASGSCFEQCVPYEGNEHLLGEKNDCDEYYKTWE